MNHVAVCLKLDISDDGRILKYQDDKDLQFRESIRSLYAKLGSKLDSVIFVTVGDLLNDGSFGKYYKLIDTDPDGPLAFECINRSIKPSIIFNKRKDELHDVIESNNIVESPVYNPKEIANLGNKNICLVKFGDYMPATALSTDVNGLLGLLETHNDLVIKPLRENGGRNIHRLTDGETKSFLLKDQKSEYIVQEFIETNTGIEGIVKGRHDVRLYVVDSNIELMSVRKPAKGSFLANTSKGASITFLSKEKVPVELGRIAKRIIKQITTISQHHTISLDFFNTRDGWKLIEINDQPGLPAEYQTEYASSLLDSVVQSMYSYSILKNEMQQLSNFKISTRLITQKAIEKGYKIKVYESTQSANSRMIECTKDGVSLAYRSLCTSLTPSFGVFAAEDKVLTNNLLSASDVPMPDTFILVPGQTFKDALPFLRNHGSVVVKPVDANHGDGVSVGVKSEQELKKSIDHARKYCGTQPDILIQKMVSGEEYRFLVLGDDVIAVATRRPPSVVGDGASTVRELIGAKNADPRRGEGHLAELTKIDISEVEENNKKGFLEHKPAKNEVCYVLKTSNLSKGGDSIDVTDIASEKLKNMAIKAAKACYLGIAGVDIITKDIKSDNLEECHVIEVNVSPGIRMHQFPTEGTARDVAGMIFDAIEQQAQTRNDTLKVIGVSTKLDFIGYRNLKGIYARVDSGARTSSLWATSVKEKDGTVSFKLFGPTSNFYTGKVVHARLEGTREVTSSTGHKETRYVVTLPIKIRNKKIRAKFTLSDRSKQVYPILIGRNTLRGNFLVDSSDPGDAVIFKYPEEEKEFNETEAL